MSLPRIEAAAGRPDPATGWLYRHRGATAAPFALLAVVGARPGAWRWLAGGLLIAAGEGLRLWAAAHIGPHSRGLVARAPELVRSGPYAHMRHPLYAGNALICGGLLVMTAAFVPWFPMVFAAAFITQYVLFVRREERLLRDTFGSAWLQYAGATPAFGWAAGARRGAGPARPLVRRGGFRSEWPTLRTLLALLALIALKKLVRYL